MLRLLLSNLTLLARVVNNIKLLEWCKDDSVLIHSNSPVARSVTLEDTIYIKSLSIKPPYSFVREH